jgi:protein-tyrosine-phosphatase
MVRPQTKKILIVDGKSNAARSVLQSLGAAGYRCCIAATDLDASTFASRYATWTAIYPSPLTDRSGFESWVLDFQRQHQFDLIMPTTEASLIPLHEMRPHPLLDDVLAIPSIEAVNGAFNKEKVHQLAQSLDIPTPDSLLVRTLEELDQPEICDWISQGAVVVKPIRSKVWADADAAELQVKMVSDQDELHEVVAAFLSHTPVQLQQWVPGIGVGIELLANQGEMVLTFAHQRIHEVPLTGGGSSYRMSIDPPPNLVQASARLMAAYRWHGVAMVEFRVDPKSGRYWLMEINGRFWGSLPLAVFAGADFPLALVELLLFERNPSGPPPRAGAYCRYFARDILWIKAILVNRDDRPTLLKRPLVSSLMEWNRVWLGKETWDGASFRDPGPMLHEVTETLRNETRIVITKVKRLALLRDARKKSERRLAALSGKRKILVLCYGNICRSPYVAHRLQQQMGAMDLEIRSSGFHQKTNRPSPLFLQNAAKRHGIDLDAHRSSIIRHEDLVWADQILVMDQRNYQQLLEMDAAFAEKVIWLAVAGKGRSVEIADPYDLDSKAVEEILSQMDDCVTGFLAYYS